MAKRKRARNALSVGLPRNKWVNAKVMVTSGGKIQAKVDENVLGRLGRFIKGVRNPDLRITKGSEQEYWFRQLTSGGMNAPERYLRGRARSYSGKYRSSFNALLSRMRKAGYKIERTPGVRGGEWSARYRAIAPDYEGAD